MDFKCLCFAFEPVTFSLLHFLFIFFSHFHTHTEKHTSWGCLCILQSSLVFRFNVSFIEFLLGVFIFCCLFTGFVSFINTRTHTHLFGFSQRSVFRSRRYSLRTNFPVNNHRASLWKRVRCQSHFFNRLQLYIESIMLKFLRNGSYFVQRHSLSMNIITVMGRVYAFFVFHSPTLNELNWVWTSQKYFWNGSSEAFDS